MKSEVLRDISIPTSFIASAALGLKPWAFRPELKACIFPKGVDQLLSHLTSARLPVHKNMMPTSRVPIAN